MAKKKEITMDEFLESMNDDMNEELSNGLGDDEEEPIEKVKPKKTSTKRGVISCKSPLVEYTNISPFRNSPRNQPITKITIHHMAGVATLEQFDAIVHKPGRNMSSNYAIDKDARVGLFCPEEDRSWCSSSAWNDNRAITIEVSNSKLNGDWPISDKVYNKLIDLCVDICKRNNIKELTFTGDKNGSLTFHKFFSATGCVPIHSTEVLTKYGWRMLDEIQISDEIMTVSPSDMSMQFAAVQNMVPIKKDYTYNVNGMTVTNDHRVLCNNGIDPGYKFVNYGSLQSGTEYTIPAAGFYSGSGLDMTASEMVFLLEAQKHCAIDLDKGTLEFVYIMESKVGYFDTLLKNIGYEFERYQENLGPVHFTINDKRAFCLVTKYLSGKDFNWKWLDMSSTQFSYFVYKVTEHENGTWRRIYRTNSLINANIFQAICALNGRGTYLDYDKKVVYVSEGYRTIDVKNAIVEGDVEVSCVTVKTGCFLMRQNGVTTITGNCPGPYLSAKAQDICAKVNAKLGGGGSTIEPIVPVTLKPGVLVRIASTATYYDGKSMPNWVKAQNWYVYSVNGDRVIINKNEAGNSSIMSAVNAKYLTVIQNASQQPPSTPFQQYTTKLVAGTRIYTIANNIATFKTTIPATAVYTIVDETTVNGVKYGKLKSGIGWANLGVDTKVVDSTIRVGDKVSVITAKTYDGKTFKVYEKSYKVLEVKGDRVVISADGKNVTAAVKASYLKKL